MLGYVQLSWKTWPDVVALLGEHLDDNIDGTGMAHTTHRFHDPCNEFAPFLSLRMRAAGGRFIDFAHGQYLGPDTEPGTYRLHTFERKGRYLERFTVAKATRDYGNDRITLTSVDRKVFSRPAADFLRSPQLHDELFLETMQACIVIGLRNKDGWLFRQSDQQFLDKQTEKSIV